MISFVGIDASKGYADFCIINEGGRVLRRFRADDTARGHQQAQECLGELIGRGDASGFKAAVESSGGIERNWLHSFREMPPELGVSHVYQINPLYIVNLRERKLHRHVSDATSARTIAEFLRSNDEIRQRPDQHHEARRLQTSLDELIAQRANVIGQLKGVLVTSHPELVQFCRSKISSWLLRVLKQWPSMECLKGATQEELTAIPYVTEARARQLVELANQTVASTSGPATRRLIRSFISRLEFLTSEIDEISEYLDGYFQGDRTLEILDSLPGIGFSTARLLRLFYGDFQTFHSEGAVVAFAGLDPRIEQSGDVERHRGISRRGRSNLRGKLFNCALAAIRSDTKFRDFYNRLRTNGKPKKVAVTAVMAKLLRVAFACVMKDQLYDKEYESKPRERRQPKIESFDDPAAPISRRAAKRRKAASTHEVEPQKV